MSERDYVGSAEQKAITKAQEALYELQVELSRLGFDAVFMVRAELTKVENVIRSQFKRGIRPADKCANCGAPASEFRWAGRPACCGKCGLYPEGCDCAMKADQEKLRQLLLRTDASSGAQSEPPKADHSYAVLAQESAKELRQAVLEAMDYGTPVGPAIMDWKTGGLVLQIIRIGEDTPPGFPADFFFGTKKP